MKSRTVIGRTISRVKTRITSLGAPESPNPLRAPPSATDKPLPPLPPLQSTKPSTNCVRNVSTSTTDPRSSPQLTALQIETSTWTVSNAHPKYHTTAYLNINISALAQNATVSSTNDKQLLDNAPGSLLDLELTTSLTGPGVKITEYGTTYQAQLHSNESWTVVVYIGIKDTSLASKLSTSLRSINKRTGGRLGRYTNIDVINKWLDVLQNDNAADSVAVTAKVRYRHSFLPIETRLENVAVCKIGGNRSDEMKREGLKAESDEEGEDDEEERLREARVYGAPWLL